MTSDHENTFVPDRKKERSVSFSDIVDEKYEFIDTPKLSLRNVFISGNSDPPVETIFQVPRQKTRPRFVIFIYNLL